MKMMSSWIICSLLILGTGILCDRKLERRQAVSSCTENNDDNFRCTNGLCIEWSLVCDRRNDCSDGSDETKELCARYEYGTNMSMDCGKEMASNTVPWLAYVHKKGSRRNYIGMGSIIAPNVVIAMAEPFWRSDLKYKRNSVNDGGRYLYTIQIAEQSNRTYGYVINAEIIYFVEDFGQDGSNDNELAAIVLADKILFDYGNLPICIDWYRKYNVQDLTGVQLFSSSTTKNQEFMILNDKRTSSKSYIDNSSCINLYDSYNFTYSKAYEEFCIRIIYEKKGNELNKYQTLNILLSDNYFLTGYKGFWSTLNQTSALAFIDIKNYVPWIRGILNKHGTLDSCILRAIEGVVYFFKNSSEILSPGTLVNPTLTVNENCEAGYHKTHLNSYRVCQSNGKWKTISDHLCLKMCPPLLSDSLDIKCSFNGKYSNCSNLSIPNTTATASCKRSYSAQNGQEDTPLELLCKSNGEWNEKLYTCTTQKLCVLPTAEGVVYTYEDSFESLPHGTLINHTLIVNENCEIGYHNAYPNSFRACQRNGKWKLISDKLCFKMCPPLLSDSLVIKCSYNGRNAYCSNFSIPNTTATASCKPSYSAPNGQEDTPLELVCQSNGKWNTQLYMCKLENRCVLPTLEGVEYTYEYSNEKLIHGTLINPTITVNENCEVGYYNAHPNSFRVCQRNGKWKIVSEKLCLKMCPPLLSDSLVIKCSYNGRNAYCSNFSIPNTTATASCKPSYSAPNGQEDTPLELVCRSNGKWNTQLFKCKLKIPCVLPTFEGVVYTNQHSNKKLPHGTLINPTVTVNENCEVGYHNARPNSFRVCQKNGNWRTVSEKLCLKMCPPLISDSLDIICTLNGKIANCSNPSIPDTIASPTCKTTHHLPNGQAETPLDIHCQSNGEWSNQLYRCEPTCGKLFIQTEPLIENGKIAMVGTAPWNVGIYKFNINNTNYDLICGGSIISHRLVVSAAHCFWEKGISHKISVHDDFYKIAVGKYSRDLSVTDNQFTKIMNVEMVHLKETFNGYVGNYIEDIAMVLLKNKISFSNGIAPVCIDWSSKYKEVNGDIGKIVGWGRTEKGIVSPILLEASLPYFNNGECRKMFTSDFEPYVTVDKFCAGFTSVSGQRLHKGDSGAGLCFLHTNLYYLTGVTSSRDPETNYSVALLTDVKYHINWIRDFYVNSV